MALHTSALQALYETEVETKVSLTIELFKQRDQLNIHTDTTLQASACLPTRPQRTELIAPEQVPKRNVSTPEGRTALIHVICRLKFNAINLALDAVWRFARMPRQSYLD